MENCVKNGNFFLYIGLKKTFENGKKWRNWKMGKKIKEKGAKNGWKLRKTGKKLRKFF